jgi:hypothetical protein
MPSRHRLALPVALLALVAALASPAIAAGMVTSAQIKNETVQSVDIRNGTIQGKDVRNGAISRAKLSAGAQNPQLVRKRVVATNGASIDAARVNAPRVVLLKEGAITVYAKCYTDTSTNTTVAQTFAASSAPGAVFDSEQDGLFGGDDGYLSPGVSETDASIDDVTTTANGAASSGPDEGEFVVFTSAKKAMRGMTALAVKNGTAPAGNGAYGTGNVCLFSAYAFVG